MTPIPEEAIRLVGRSYFASRFHAPGSRAGATDERWFESLPLRLPPQDRLASGSATLDVGGVQVPLFQGVNETQGGESLVAHSNGRKLIAGGIHARSLELGFDPWFALGAGLLGFAGATGNSEGALQREHTPWVDRLANEFATTLGRAGANLRPRSPWPGNAPFAVCLTHDVDRSRKTFQYVTHLGREKGLRGTAKRNRRVGRPYWGFDVIRDIETGAGVRSTFFMLHEGPEAKRGVRNRVLAWGLADFEDPELSSTVRALARERWEIGLHASLASTVRPERIVTEKSKLEAIVGDRVDGVRQHHLRLGLPDRWDQFAGAGFAYDTSFGFQHTWGFRAGTAFPIPLAGSKDVLQLCEVPLHMMDSTLAFPQNAWAECTRALDAVQSVGGVLTVLFHQRYFDSHNYPGYADLFERLVAEAQSRRAWIAPVREVVKVWFE